MSLARRAIIDELRYYSFFIRLNRFGGSCNTHDD